MEYKSEERENEAITRPIALRSLKGAAIDFVGAKDQGISQMRNLVNTLKRIWNHPLNSNARAAALGRFVRWQLARRLLPLPSIIPFVNDAKLLMDKGHHAVTGNYYNGLMEFEEMSFLLHFLRDDDLYVDIGANVGTFVVLASAVAGAQTVAVEPSIASYQWLKRNCALNDVSSHVEFHCCAVGGKQGVVEFSENSTSSINHVLTQSELESSVSKEEVPLVTLDSILGQSKPSLIKIDVEGFETAVIAGASKTLESQSLKCLILELAGHGKRYGFDEQELHRIIFGFGFQPCSYNPFTRTLSRLEMCDGDSNGARQNGLFCRDISFVAHRLNNASPFSVLGRSL